MSADQTDKPLPTMADMVTAWINSKGQEELLRARLEDAENATVGAMNIIADAAQSITPRGTSFVVRAWGHRYDSYDMHSVIVDVNASGSVNVDFINDMTEKALGK